MICSIDCRALKPDDREAIRALSAEIRRTIEGTPIPGDLAAAITGPLARLGEQDAYAVRSSATAEDSPAASFAGQHDTYLNIVGPAAILEHISRCWASLFTERAVIYRLRNGLDHRKVQMAVVVQQMVFPQAAGILFTADPVTGNRKVVSVEASFGLGEALVSGLVNADVYKVRDGEVVARTVATKQHAHLRLAGRRDAGTGDRAGAAGAASADGRAGRATRPAGPADRSALRPPPGHRMVPGRGRLPDRPEPADHHAVPHPRGRRWREPRLRLRRSWADDDRPHEAPGAVPVSADGGPAHVRGGREAVRRRHSGPGFAGKPRRPPGGHGERRSADQGRARRPFSSAATSSRRSRTRVPAGAPAGGAPAPIETDPAIVAELIARSQASIAALKRDIRTKSGSALLDFILADIQELKRILFDPQSHQAIMAGMEATWWLNEQLQAWLGEKNAADTLTQSVPHNVTSEMGLALLDVADVIRPHPDVVAFLQHVEDEGFLDELPKLAGGREARDAIRAWLDKYGMRCVGEIDITRPRWSERPTTLVPMILGNIKNFEPGAGERRFEQGRQEAWKKEQELLERLRALPDGERKAEEAKADDRPGPDLHRVPGVSEVRHGQPLLRLQAGLVGRSRAPRAGRTCFVRRKTSSTSRSRSSTTSCARTKWTTSSSASARTTFRSYQALTPPRVLTSDGEVVAGAYRRDDLPAGALVGLPVSAGTIEGRARVILDMAEADLEAGDILVTAYTDPSWTPLFVAIKGLVTEVGGLMTHGAVIAREYGLPAVVGVEHATRLIRDGQRIRVHGTDGYVGDPALAIDPHAVAGLQREIRNHADSACHRKGPGQQQHRLNVDDGLRPWECGRFEEQLLGGGRSADARRDEVVDGVLESIERFRNLRLVRLLEVAHQRAQCLRNDLIAGLQRLLPLGGELEQLLAAIG